MQSLWQYIQRKAICIDGRQIKTNAVSCNAGGVGDCLRWNALRFFRLSANRWGGHVQILERSGVDHLLLTLKRQSVIVVFRYAVI